MSSPLVTVVVPTFNRASLLPQAVESVLGQTVGDLELIVVDDGSGDDSLDVLARYDDGRLRVVPIEHTGSIGAARNAALDQARGEIVALLDSDDAWLPHKLERQLEILERDPEVGLVCSNALVIDEQGVELGHRYLNDRLGKSGEVLAELLKTNFVIVSTAVVRRTLLERIGRFTSSAELFGIEDYDAWLKLATLCRFAYLPEPLALYREHGGSMRGDVSRCAYWRSLLAALDRLEEFVGLDDPRRSLVRPRRAGLLVELARAERVEVGREAARRTVARALRTDPGAVASLAFERTAGEAARRARAALGARVRRLRAGR